MTTGKVLVISPDGTNLGSHTMEDAERIAEQRFGLDLLEVRPGVFKIVDVGKLKYEASKRKQPKVKPIKEMKFKLNIGVADFDMKINQIKRFLNNGNNVKVTIWFSGREVNRPEAGIILMKEIAAQFEEGTMIHMDAELLGKNMHMSIEPGQRKT